LAPDAINWQTSPSQAIAAGAEHKLALGVIYLRGELVAVDYHGVHKLH
jgi:hypothetical protein